MAKGWAFIINFSFFFNFYLFSTSFSFPRADSALGNKGMGETSGYGSGNEGCRGNIFF